MFGRAAIRLGIGPHSSFILFPALKTTAVNCLSFSAMSTFRNLFHKKCGRKYNLCSVVRILWQVCGLHTVTNRRFVIKAKKVKVWTVEATELQNMQDWIMMDCGQDVVEYTASS